MTERVWDKFLTERDKAVFAAGGFGARAGFGKRPALLVIDVNWAFCGERPEPILESIKRWRTSCGEESWVALGYIKRLIEAARLPNPARAPKPPAENTALSRSVRNLSQTRSVIDFAPLQCCYAVRPSPAGLPDPGLGSSIVQARHSC